MADPLLVVRDVVKEYPAPTEPLRVLDGISFEVAKAASLAVMGPSGSGKSTLLNIVSTLDRPTSGSVTFGGEAIHEFDEERAAEFRSRQIGFVFQEHHLLPQCTALENVLVPRMALGPVREADITRARSLLERVGLAERERHFPSELSGGERQRVAVARALVNEPGLVLCDEPTGNLDAEATESVADLLAALRDEDGLAMVVVTHNETFARHFGRTLRLVEGKLHE
jgi:lipoprotein-releasing system ATP-binding protein